MNALTVIDTPRELQLLADLLAMAYVQVDVATVATWDERQQKDAKNWAIAQRLKFAGHDVNVPALPDFLLPHHPLPPVALTLNMMTSMRDALPTAGEPILLKREGECQPHIARYVDHGHGYSIMGRIGFIDALPTDRWISIDQITEFRRHG